MPFKNDVFISYRHIDNRPISGTVGWIADFTEKLQAQLAFKLGYDPVVWRDPEIRGSEFFEEVILNELEQTKVLVSILSPGYVDATSTWCVRELTEFCKLSQRNIGLRVGAKCRCVKVVKSFLQRDKHPSELQGLLGYEFFEEDPELRRQRDYSYLPDGYQYKRYLDKIDQVAFDIAELLKEINQPKRQSRTQELAHTVYLAEATSDRAEYRDNIKNELLSRGYRVLPDLELPQTATEYRKAVRENLQLAKLSIHLIGERYGRTLEGDEENSFVQIQNELAAQHSSDASGFSRIIWIAPDLVPQGKFQPAFIETLRTSKEAQAGADLLERSFEELKNRIIEKLTTPKPTSAKLLQFPQESLVRIYLMCDKLDFPTVKAIRDYLFDRKFEVVLAARDGDATQVIQYHKDNLLECDATIIYYGHGNEFWLHSKLSDLRKVNAWGREKPMLCKAIYLAAPENEDKRDIKTWEAVLLAPPGYEGLAQDALEAFIAQIENARGEQPKIGSGGGR
jgi:hypothetical protein